MTGRTRALRPVTGPVSGEQRLVCFPHGGGSAHFYQPWGAMVPPGVEVLAVQYPGREDRIDDGRMHSIQAEAREIAAELLSLPRKELVLFGHSAHERARFDGLRRGEDRRDFLAGRALARVALGDRLGVGWEDVTLTQRCPTCLRPGHGRPEPVDGLHVSWSHAGGCVAVCVGEGPLGVDMEPVASAASLRDVWPAAVSWRDADLVARWCASEAAAKCGLESLDSAIGRPAGDAGHADHPGWSRGWALDDERVVAWMEQGARPRPRWRTPARPVASARS